MAKRRPSKPRGRKPARPREPESLGVAALAWFEPDQWPRLREAAADPEQFGETYEQWLEQAQRTFQDLARKDVFVARVPVDVAELAVWCQAEGRPLDAEARAEFAALKLHEQMGGRA